MLGDLSAQYESNGYPGTISNGWGDPGGKSYGTYQFSSNAGSLNQFMDWLSGHYPDYYNRLAGYQLCSEGFDVAWKRIANEDPNGFGNAQYEYVKAAYYDPAVEILANNYWHIDNHHNVLKDVVWSRAVQYGVGNILDMWNDAVHSMFNAQSGDYSGYPNLSYIDAPEFDYDFIVAVYTTCKSWDWNHSSLRESLNNRFDREMHDALDRL